MGMGKIYLASKRTYKRKAKTAPNKKLATVGTVKRLINYNVDKLRYDDQVITASNITSTATITQLNGFIATDSMINDDFECRYLITNPTLSVAIRIIFFQWKDTTTPVVADVLSYTTDPLSALGRSSDARRNGGGKIHLLRDMLISMNTSDKNIKTGVVKFYKKKLLDVQYDGSEYKNRLYICYLSNTAVTPPVLTLNESYLYHEN